MLISLLLTLSFEIKEVLPRGHMHSVFKYTQIFSLLAFCLLSGCKSSSTKTESIAAKETNQKLKINIVSEPQNLDPRKSRSLNDMNLAKMFMEGLTRTGKNDEITLAQAQSITVSEDQLIYTIKLKDSKWSNGDTVTAQDFSYAWKKVLAPEFISDNAYQLFVIKNAKDIKNGGIPNSLLGVNCPDEKTIVIELEQPVPYFNKLLSMPVFFPVNQKTDRKNPNWAQSKDTFVSNGPFQIASWNHNDQITAVKNPLYWDQKNVKLAEIEMVMVSEDTGIQMFESAQLDWEGSPFSALPVDAIPTLKKASEFNQSQALATYFVSINTKKKSLNL